MTAYLYTSIEDAEPLKQRLNFYCTGCRQHLGGEKTADELSRFQLALNSPPLFGACSLGEVGTVLSTAVIRYFTMPVRSA
jgi:hypothetical protein